MKVVGGQVLKRDAPWYCSMCGKRYTARVLVEFWELTVAAGGQRWRWVKHLIRLCRTDKTSMGCSELGLGALFKHDKGQSAAWRNVVKVRSIEMPAKGQVKARPKTVARGHLRAVQ